jgi:hypothetical protein
VNTLFEAGNLGILGVLALPFRRQNGWWSLYRQFAKASDLLGQIRMARIIQKGFGDTSYFANR